MTALQRIPKRSTVRLKSAQKITQDERLAQSAAKQKNDSQQVNLISATHLSPATLIHLQGIVGNHAVQRMLKQRQPGAIQHVPLLGTAIDHDHFSPRAVQGGETIQRSIEPLEGASSGWFRKGCRDKINAMVHAYNELEIQSSGSKRSVAGYQKLLPEIQKIWQAAKAWYVDVMKDSPQKAEAIGDWIKNEVEREEDAKKAQIGELQEAAALKAASDGASYNVLYTTPEFTTGAGGAGVRWLQTPALAPIYQYFMIQVQFEGAALKAFEDVTRYRQNPSRAEALRIYHKYDMGTASQLNITGEGVTGGEGAINLVRQQMTALEADASAAAPATLGPLKHHLFM